MIVITMLYQTETEKRQHSSAIGLLARDSGIAEDAIRPFYENELRALQEQAHVKTFLSILASRRVREKIDNGLAYRLSYNNPILKNGTRPEKGKRIIYNTPTTDNAVKLFM